jgi:hypothetical protein
MPFGWTYVTGNRGTPAPKIGRPKRDRAQVKAGRRANRRR